MKIVDICIKLALVCALLSFRPAVAQEIEIGNGLQRYGGRASRAASLPPSYTITRDTTAGEGKATVTSMSIQGQRTKPLAR